MPSEDGVCSIEDAPQLPAAEKNGGHHHHHHHHGYQKLLHIFRFKKKASKTQPQDGREQNQERAQDQGPEERRQQLERDMRTNWEELPATLKRRKERVSQAVLAEFHSEHESSAASSAGSEPASVADSTSGTETSAPVRQSQNGDADTDSRPSSASSSGAENGAEGETARNGSDSAAKVNGEGRETSLSSSDATATTGKPPEGEEKSKAANGSDAAGGERKEDADDVTCHVGARPTGHPEAAVEPAVGGRGSDTKPSDTCGSPTVQNGQSGGQNGGEKCEAGDAPEGQEAKRPLDGAALLEQERLSLRELERLRQNLHLALSSATDLDREQRHVVELLRQAVSSEEYLLLNTSSSSSASSSSPSSASSRSSSMSDPCPSSPAARNERSEDRGPDATEDGYEDMRPDASAVEAYYDALVRQSDEEPPLPFVVIPKATALDRASALETKRRRAEDAYDRPRPSRWKRQLAESARPPGCSMDTIVEEDEKLSVREILRRFEQLGAGGAAREGPDEKSATLRQIQETLRCLEEKVRHYEGAAAAAADQHQLHQKQQPVISALDGYHHQQQQQTQVQHQQVPLQQHQHQRTSPQHGSPRRAMSPPPAHNHLDAWTGRPQHTGTVLTTAHELSQQQYQHQQHTLPNQHDGKHSLLQFAMLHFRQSPEKFEMLKAADGSISGSLKVIESLKSKKNKSKKGNKENEWTWKEQVDLVKFSSSPIEQSLLRLDSVELNDLAIECFVSIMRYMGDLPMPADVTEVKCVYTILMHCHKHEQLRDEVYCQLMKQTTNNKSTRPDSCQRGWRLFSIVAAYFICSDVLRPYLFKYLETAAYDKRRAYHGTATVCLHNLRKTFKYGGRKNVPSVEEITAISAGRNSKRQIYRLPGGTERVVNTKCTTVVQDVIEEMCAMINVQSPAEMDEFSLYCIVEGDTFTMPLAREEYVLDVTTELHKNQQVFYLIFCRSVWHFPLRLDSHLYIEVVFNQIAPDYLEGLLLVMPGEQLEQDVIYDIAKMAALLHRAADMTHLPTMKETKFLLPKPALSVRDVKPAQWVNMVQSNWHDVQGLSTIQAKAQVLDILSKWPLFGSSFFAVKRVSDPKERSEHILALNRHGVHFIDLVTHETLIHYPFSEVISTRKVKSEDGTLFLDMKCGNLMQQRITRLQTDQAHEISRLIRQYITMEQRLRHS